MATARKKAAARPWEFVEVPLTHLHLDLENYRHEPVANESEAIAWLYNEEKMVGLARDIAKYGALNPLELIGVVPVQGNPGHFVAVEGNRRLCSLLLMRDPDRAPTPEARDLMRQLGDTVRLPANISVVRFDGKDDAKHWVDLRHLGPQDGQGLRAWNTSQKERAADEGGPNQLALAVLDRARAGGWLAGSNAPAVTTLTRYLKNREVRAALGLGHHRDLVFTHEMGQVDSALQQFLLDATPNDGQPALVHSRSNDIQRSAYARNLRDRGIAPTTQLGTPAPAGAVAAAPAAASRNRPDPAKRKYLVPSGFVCNANDKNLRLLFSEMKRTNIDDHEFANAYLLRAFIERVMTLYLKVVERSYNPPDDQALTVRVAGHLDPLQRDNAFKPIRTAGSNRDASHSLHTLGSGVHAVTLFDRRALVRVWQNWEHSLMVMLIKISSK